MATDPVRFPPVGAFEAVASAADLDAVMELEGWTDDRLVAERLARLPQADWLFGVPNASVVMAAFLHAAPGGGRFSGPELGAYYAYASLLTAVAEVAHQLRREAFARGLAEGRRTCRGYTASLLGEDYVDVRGCSRPELYASDSYGRSQPFGEAAREAGRSGVVYDSVRHAGGVNVVGYRPRQVATVTPTSYYDILAPLAGRVVVTTVR